MLIAAQLGYRVEPSRSRRAPSLHSPKQRYHQYVQQRIEDYKQSLARGELLLLGDAAAAEARDAEEGQYFLTEVVMEEMVDRLIMKRLRLPSFTKWRQSFAKIRQAQQSPTHWGLERNSAAAAVLPRLEAGDHALVVGGGAEAAVYLLSAYDVRVTCLCGDNATCCRIEAKMASEGLTGRFQAYVAMLGTWFPDLDAPAHLVVIDAGTLSELPSPRRVGLMARLQDVTVPGGLHAVIAGDTGIAPETWLSLYPDWERLPLPNEPSRRGTKRSTPPGVLLARPLPQPQSQADSA